MIIAGGKSLGTNTLVDFQAGIQRAAMLVDEINARADG